MTTKPQLRLFRTPPSQPEHTPLHADTGHSQLWDTVRDHDIHPVLREPALLELARRRDPDLLSFCEYLLNESTHDEWVLAVKTIAAQCTSESLEKLVMLFASTINSDDRLLLLDLVAKSVTADFTHPFSIMVRDIAKPGEIDVSDWTSVAIATLQSVCKRYSIDARIDDNLAASEEGTAETLELSFKLPT